MEKYAVITYKHKNKVYHDSIRVDLETTYEEVHFMFKNNHAIIGDLNECKIISIKKHYQ